MELAVLLSIQPQWCEKIASGEKTVEVRKTAPKIGIPFMCYMYCTSIKNSPADWLYRLPNQHELYLGAASRDYDFIKEEGDFLNRKVIGEFACDKIVIYPYDRTCGYLISEDEFNRTLMTGNEFCGYGKGKTLYGWHISELKIYDRPKELVEFTPWCDRYIRYDRYDVCCDCKNAVYDEYGELSGCGLARPPQSWCYAEELYD